jgi:hypothetical protein
MSGKPLRAVWIGFGAAIGAALLLILVLFAASLAPHGPTSAEHQVSRAEFERAGSVWPLSVERGEIGCSGLAAWFRAPDGTVYGLNGFATGERGYADVTPIWLEDAAANTEWRANTGVDPRYPTRLSIGDLLDRANALCEDAQ